MNRPRRLCVVLQLRSDDNHFSTSETNFFVLCHPRFFHGPDVLQTSDGRLYHQHGASIWKADRGRFLEIPAGVRLETFMQQQRVRPTIELVDHAGDNVRGSWKSSIALANTYARGAKHGVQVQVSSIERIISDHTIVKIDVEGSELPLLAKSRNWKQVRVLVFEFSAARSRKHFVGPLPFASVLEALRQGGFTHLSIPSSSGIRSPKFWESNAHGGHLDFLVFCYRQQADEDQGYMCKWATPEMENEMNTLPALLKAMPFPEKTASLLDPELLFPLCEWLQVWAHRC